MTEPIGDYFGGRRAEGMNALRAAIKKAAANNGFSGEYADYEFLEKMPRTSMVIYIVNALGELGYEIQRKGGEGECT